MRYKTPSFFFLFLFASAFVFFSCDPDPEDLTVPKPRGYFRIDLPQHKYKLYDSVCPFKFETPKYSIVMNDVESNSEPCWLNIVYPHLGAVMHMSYKVVDGNLNKYLLDSDQFARNHTVKASGMNENVVMRDSAKVYGLMYDIEGNAASNIQFYLTDSTKNFIRGSLYFNVRPNIDSLQPVINFLREDIIHMLQTFQWKESKIELKLPGLAKKK